VPLSAFSTTLRRAVHAGPRCPGQPCRHRRALVGLRPRLAAQRAAGRPKNICESV